MNCEHALAQSAEVDVTSLGAKADGTDSRASTEAFRSAFVLAANGTVQVPPGTYLLDNSSGPLIISNFSGELRLSAGATILFTTNNLGGLWFVGGTHARVSGLHAGYLVPPLSRNSPQEEIKFDATTDTIVTDAYVENSPAAGILFSNSIRPRVVHATIVKTKADGLHFANCQDAEVTNLTTDETGDDGLAFVNYAAYPNYTGGVANNITIRHSAARGISVVGQSLVNVAGFLIESTSSSGLLCGEDTFWKTRIPTGVRFSSGRIRNAGAMPPPAGNNFGIEVNNGSCAFSDIEVTGAAGRGVSALAPDGSVSLNDIRVNGNLSGDAFNIQVKQAGISNASADNSPGYGFYFGNSATVIGSNLSTLNVSTENPLHRAVWFENGSTIKVTGLHIVDTQPVASGYLLGVHASGNKPAGYIRGVSAKIAGGQMQIENDSRGVSISKTAGEGLISAPAQKNRAHGAGKNVEVKPD